MVSPRRGIGRNSNGLITSKMNRLSGSKDGGEIEARNFVGDESIGQRRFLKSGIDRKSHHGHCLPSNMYEKNKGKLQVPDAREDNCRSAGGVSGRKRFQGGSSRSNGSIEVQKKKRKNGHFKCNAENGGLESDKKLSQCAGPASIKRTDDAELIRNSIDKRKFSKLLEGHHMLPGVGTSVHSERKTSKVENSEDVCDTGIKVRGKSGVLKLIPNKRMKLGVYEQTCEHKEAEESRKLLLSDSHRNALVGMGKKLNGSLGSSRQILKNHSDTSANRMNKLQNSKTEVDDSSSSGTESKSISDGYTEVMSRRKKNSIQVAHILNREKKEPRDAYHPENTKEKVFRGIGMNERMSTPIMMMNNHSNKLLLNRKTEVCTLETEDHISLSQESGSMDLSCIRVEAKSSVETTSVMKNSRESKNGRQTEKQMLRDQIKNMLVEAGWKIDMRPRRGRTYQDHVYVSPAGTEYWSITNAYHALEKQFNGQGNQIDRLDDQENRSFSRIPADVLSMLTRKTVKKKIREQLAKKKHKLEKGGKSTKGIKSKLIKRGNVIASATQRGKSMKEKLKAKGKFRKISEDSVDSRQGNSTSINTERAGKPVRAPKSFVDCNVGMLGKKNNKQKRFALLARSSNKEDNADSNESLRYPGKLTVLSWLIDSGTVPENGKVQYMNRRRTKAMLDGWITKEGVHCSCCSKILSVSKFEIHAGSKLRQPFQNIYVETGVSLLQCQLEAWNLQKECDREEFHCIQTDGDDPNDDTCGICGDGGNLICCDGCPSTFHQGCLNVKMLPPGDWHCPNCSCKFCGVADVGDSPLFSCSQCERKYHQSCTGETKSRPHYSFCGKNCRKLFEQLQKLLGVKNDLEGGYSWTLIQRIDGDSESFPRGLPQRAEWNSKLAVALAVMDECFLPIVDRRSGINLIHNVLYNCGSNFSRLNYSGFYTAILERGDEIICAASIRIHGTSLAEMPFIGTRHMYRRQGMCRRLLNAIELVLCSLNVEKLIIPSISELMHTWTVVFGFKPLEESHRQEMKSMSLLVFPGTDMLQKSMLKINFARGNSTDEAVGKINELCDKRHDMHVDSNELLITSFVKPDAHALKEGLIEHDMTRGKEGCAMDGNCQIAVVGSSITSEPNCNISESLVVEVDTSATGAITPSDTVAQPFGSASECNSQVSGDNNLSEG